MSQRRRPRVLAYAAGLAALSAVLGASTIIVLQPHWFIRILAARSPSVVYFVDTDEPVVALTIDDGPDGATTPAILHVLESYEAHATFFLISERVAANEGITRDLVERGHELGNHMTRDEPSVRLPPSEFERSLLEAHAVLARFAPLRWLRPGSGWYNGDMHSIAALNGYRIALGSIYPYDAQIPSVRFAAWHILRNVRPGAVIALHDGGARGHRTVETLRRVLPALRQRGYRVVTLSEAWSYR
jgi:peptidoglycan/xylan/chitin deacetylase (PgdA/CDA1 family)